MRAYVDQETCIGCGLCVSTSPDGFEDGKAQAMADTTDENRASVLDAIDGCPVSAIREDE